MPSAPRIRLATYAVAVAAIAVSSVVITAVDQSDREYWSLLQLLAVVSLAGAWWIPGWRSVLLAVGAGVCATRIAYDTGAAVSVVGLVFLSVCEDKRARPWVGLAGGVLGGAAGAVVTDNWYVWSGALTATVIGGGAAMLLLSWERGTRLTGETRALRGQAAWLEQRTALARELHDVVGHQVTAMVVQAEAGQVGDARIALQRIGDLGRTALSELDQLVVHLRDPDRAVNVAAPPGLLDIDELLAAPLRSAGVQVEVRIGDGLGLEEADVLVLYRIAQEALTNVARHAQAQHAWVELGRHGDGVRLRVSDDGVGPPATPERGAGLVGIEERVAAYDGHAELVGRPGGGAILDVSIRVGDR